MKKVGVVMGSDSDLPVMKGAIDVLRAARVPFEVSIVSAHRTPEAMLAYAQNAERNGTGVIIAGAGGAAHLPGMIAAATVVPVLGVPVASGPVEGYDALLSIIQMPRGVAVGTVQINEADRAAQIAVRILNANQDPEPVDAARAFTDQADSDRVSEDV